ncbi:50S ribosomal protein L32 [Candidatus Kaiserbacteria bacterium]|nr:50S ribosomal protein L32 [Candidatus Kaiserbacteria bacterium]
MVVRMRVNRSKTGKRRSHHAISGVRLSTCSCGALRQSHRVCPACGKYNDKIVVDVVARAEREARRAKRRSVDQPVSQNTDQELEPAKT